jgi:hypothetical protein
MPEEIGELVSLRQLNLSGNYLEGRQDVPLALLELLPFFFMALPAI